MVSKWVISPLLNGVYWGCTPLILTIDPNFLGHPSTNDMVPQGQLTFGTSPNLFCIKKFTEVSTVISPSKSLEV